MSISLLTINQLTSMVRECNVLESLMGAGSTKKLGLQFTEGRVKRQCLFFLVIQKETSW